ncbi:MAG: hypothetical protein ACOCZU_01940 [Planctomycetota bacterium]
MQEDFYRKLKVALAEERLAAYGKDGCEPVIVMGRYLWNMALCESLYSPLQMCEVALRNAVHCAITRRLGATYWFDQLQLTPWGRREVQKSKNRIVRDKRQVTAGRVVAELNFGFWTSLFEDHYERNTPFLPRGISEIFPNMPKSLHKRKRIKAILERIRTLRNRVFHHERIIHWKNLEDQHAQILQVIQWISEPLADLASKLDRFHETNQKRIQPWVESLQNHWPSRPFE